MGKRANQAVWDMFKPEMEPDDEPEYSPDDDWESGFSDWKHNKDDDLATAVRRYARPVGHIRLGDEPGAYR